MDVWGCHPGAPWAIPLLLGWKVIHAPYLLAGIQGRLGFLAKGAQTRGGLLGVPSQPPTQVLPLPARPEARGSCASASSQQSLPGSGERAGAPDALGGGVGSGGRAGRASGQEGAAPCRPYKGRERPEGLERASPAQTAESGAGAAPQHGAAAPRAQVPAIASREGRLRPHRQEGRWGCWGS